MRHDNRMASDTEAVERAGMDLRVLRTCHSTWYFEPGRLRFQRVPHDIDVAPEGEWAPYHRLDIDPPSGSFMVTLNDEDTRMLRSWVHHEPCPHCRLGDPTEELKLQPLGR